MNIQDEKIILNKKIAASAFCETKDAIDEEITTNSRRIDKVLIKHLFFNSRDDGDVFITRKGNNNTKILYSKEKRS